MGALAIRNLDDRTHERLRRRAAENGRSLEAEVRVILDDAVQLPERNIALAFRDLAIELDGIELDLEPRAAFDARDDDLFS